MEIEIFQVDAFTDQPFGGNPAAVCPLSGWLDDGLLQAIAAENNLSETAFFVPEGDGFRLRWFTPALEVALCGHATLATAYVIFNHLRPEASQCDFETLSGRLTVRRENNVLSLNLPALPASDQAPPAAWIQPLGAAPLESYQVERVHGAPYALCIYAEQAEVAALAPDFTAMQANVIATAPAHASNALADKGDGNGGGLDFVSRFFAPMSGINEDPVTGSAHCTLVPYWARRLGRNKLSARQISARGGNVGCELRGDRVILSGRCAPYLKGRITI